MPVDTRRVAAEVDGPLRGAACTGSMELGMVIPAGSLPVETMPLQPSHIHKLRAA
jgi:hypothetical protein